MPLIPYSCIEIMGTSCSGVSHGPRVFCVCLFFSSISTSLQVEYINMKTYCPSSVIFMFFTLGVFVQVLALLSLLSLISLSWGRFIQNICAHMEKWLEHIEPSLKWGHIKNRQHSRGLESEGNLLQYDLTIMMKIQNGSSVIEDISNRKTLMIS